VREPEIVSLGRPSIVTHLYAEMGVRWCQSAIISTPPHGNHQCVKPSGQDTSFLINHLDDGEQCHARRGMTISVEAHRSGR
jgi:hypothetical protein